MKFQKGTKDKKDTQYSDSELSKAMFGKLLKEHATLTVFCIKQAIWKLIPWKVSE